MKNSKNNRYKIEFAGKKYTLITDKDNLFMEEVERIAKDKYLVLKEKMPNADDETIAILLAINSLEVQLSREIEHEKVERELLELRQKYAETSIETEDVDD